MNNTWESRQRKVTSTTSIRDAFIVKYKVSEYPRYMYMQYVFASGNVFLSSSSFFSFESAKLKSYIWFLLLITEKKNYIYLYGNQNSLYTIAKVIYG